MHSLFIHILHVPISSEFKLYLIMIQLLHLVSADISDIPFSVGVPSNTSASPKCPFLSPLRLHSPPSQISNPTPTLFHPLLFCLHLNASIIFCSISQNSRWMCEWSSPTRESRNIHFLHSSIHSEFNTCSWLYLTAAPFMIYLFFCLWVIDSKKDISKEERWGGVQADGHRDKASCSIMDWLLK